jgi:hypothetical protein
MEGKSALRTWNFHFENHWNHAMLIPMNTASEVHGLAMKLPQRSRLKLASELLRSLAPDTTPENALHEAIRRDSELESGKVAALSESEFWSGIAVRRNPS